MVSRFWLRAPKPDARQRQAKEQRDADTERRKRLRPPERALAEALDQLRAGVPLNWTQVQDDPELATLSGLQATAWESKEHESGQPSAEMRSSLLGRLSARLPEPKAQPVKQAPKALAGFSEAVPVLTQVEEDVPRLSMTSSQWAALAAAAVGVIVLLVLVGVGVFNQSHKTPLSFTWVEVRQAGQTISKIHRPPGWQATRCMAVDPADPVDKHTFVRLPDRDQLQQSVGFPVDLLPSRKTLTSTYTLALLDMAVAPCIDSVPEPSDPGAIVKLTYAATRQLTTDSGDVSPLTIFEANSVPMAIDVTSGDWKEVSVGDTHGVYWHGGPYRDVEGTNWIGEVSVLVVERGDLVSTFIGQSRQGITEELLLALVEQLGRSKQANSRTTAPKFAWVDLTQDGKTISPRQLPPGAMPQECVSDVVGPGPRRGTFTTLDDIPSVQQYVGFPILSFPLTSSAAITYTVSKIDIAVRPCSPVGVVQADPGAMVKIGYPLRTIVGAQNLEAFVDVFESRNKPTTFNLSAGSWEEVKIENANAVYWTGNGYRDPEGNVWSTNTSVLLVERNNYVVTLVGVIEAGVTRELLTQLASAMK